METVKKVWHDSTRGISKYNGLEFDKGHVWKSLQITMNHDAANQVVIFSLHVYFDGKKVFDKQCPVYGSEQVTLHVNSNVKIEIHGQADVTNITHIKPPLQPVYVEVIAEATY